jgi:hypothetical protein
MVLDEKGLAQASAALVAPFDLAPPTSNDGTSLKRMGQGPSIPGAPWGPKPILPVKVPHPGSATCDGDPLLPQPTSASPRATVPETQGSEAHPLAPEQAYAAAIRLATAQVAGPNRQPGERGTAEHDQRQAEQPRAEANRQAEREAAERARLEAEQQAQVEANQRAAEREAAERAQLEAEQQAQVEANRRAAEREAAEQARLLAEEAEKRRSADAEQFAAQQARARIAQEREAAEQQEQRNKIAAELRRGMYGGFKKGP